VDIKPGQEKKDIFDRIDRMNRIKTLPSLFKLPAVTLDHFLKIL